MKAADLRQWMDRHNKSADDVAYLTKVNRKTVIRFLDGATKTHRLVLDAFERLVRGSPERTERKATG